MRLLGHPIHVMLVHFPVALWPAHGVLHLFAARLPSGVAAVAGYWLLATGVALGWLAACFGVVDLLELRRSHDEPRFMSGVIHGLINGTVLVGFSCLLAVETPSYPAISHGGGFLAVEAALLVALGVGNYFGGAVIWRAAPTSPKANP